MILKKSFDACLSIALLLCYFKFTRAFDFSASVSSDIALNSKVTASDTCKTGGLGFTCNTTCPYRHTFPTQSNVLKTTDANCALHNFIDLHSSVNSSNGQVLFNESSSVDCPLMTVNVSGGSNNYFTFSAWVDVACTNCTVFKIGAAEMSSLSNELSLKVPEVPIPIRINISSSKWYHVVIRFNGHVSFFVNEAENHTSNTTFTGGFTNISIGPGENLTSSDSIAVADARWYSDVLTDREITKLRTGTFLNLSTDSDCRCPATAPSLVQKSQPENNIYCTNKLVPSVTNVLRLNPDSHLPIFMIDNDTTTSWNSGSANEVRVTLTLAAVYQIKKLEIMGLTNAVKMDKLIITLTNTNANSKWLFKKSCTTSDDNCKNISKNISSGTFSYDFESGIYTRESVRSLVADQIEVFMHNSSQTFFTISEINVIARCHCFGNDKDCKIGLDGNYTCSCHDSSHTEGRHCDLCEDTYFRYDNETLCDKACDCNTIGSNNDICKQVGGQCDCKKYVNKTAGRQCTECEHNSVNFSTNGCTACDCNPIGIVQCNPDKTCQCKANVESLTGKCKECQPGYYELSSSDGCKACNCDTKGTNGSQCDGTTGKCPCKTNVQGHTCDMCKDEYHGLSSSFAGCTSCDCNSVGSYNNVCNKLSGRCHCRDARATRDKDKNCEPSDLTLNPNHGPLAGGTMITVSGYSLGGDNLIITFKINNMEQKIESRNDSIVVIQTSVSHNAGEMPVTLEWTKKEDTTFYSDNTFETNTKFTFMTNPTLVGEPEAIKTYANGGCSVRVQGTHLDSVPEPRFIVHTGQESPPQTVSEICIHDDNTWMTCKTPNVSQYDGYGTRLFYGYRLDNVRMYENRSGAKLDIAPNPEIKPKDGWEFRNTFDKEIEITGAHLKQACDDADVSIMVGDKVCRLLHRDDDTISCDPDETFPGETREKVSVIVQIGNTRIIAGEIKFIQFWQTREFMYIALGVGLFVVLIIAIAVVIYVCRRQRKHENIQKHTDNMELFERPHARGNDYTPMANPVAMVSPMYTPLTHRDSKEIVHDFTSRLQGHVSKVVKSSCIERSHIHIGKTCTHKGTKIRIINGQFAKSTSSPFSGLNITIKTLVERYPETGTIPTWLNNGLLESTRLRDFVNDNIVRLLGIAVDEKQIYIIYPEMSKRTLKDYLQVATEPYTEEVRLAMCIEVAEGMNYLETQHIVHKDLAARNCWVNSDDQVKIADASFTHDIYPDEYLYQNNRYQPVRWMAPESLKQSGFYHSKSDVWSFGVLMWEVFTNGYLPYHDVEDNRKIQKCVCEERYRLGQPQDCSNNIFSVIEACHSENGKDRPNFFRILNLLQNVISPGGDTPISYVNEGGLQEDYMNINTLNASASGDETGLEDYVNFTFKKPNSGSSVPVRPSRRH